MLAHLLVLQQLEGIKCVCALNEGHLWLFGASKWKSALNLPLLPSFSTKLPQLGADFHLIEESEDVPGQISACTHLFHPSRLKQGHSPSIWC